MTFCIKSKNKSLATWPEGLYVVAKFPKLVYDERVKRIFKIFLLFILLYLFSLNLLANISYAANIQVNIDPHPIYRSTETITFTVNSDQDIFFKDTNYTLGLWGPNVRDKAYKYDVYSASIIGTNSYRKLQFEDCTINELKKEVCKTLKGNLPLTANNTDKPGTWIYRLWQGKESQNISERRNLIFKEGVYVIYDCENTENKGCPSLALYSQPPKYKVNGDIIFGIRNIRIPNKYSVWFKGDSDVKPYSADSWFNEIANDKSFPTQHFTITAKSIPGDYTLCLSESTENIFGKNPPCDFFLSLILTKDNPENVIPGIIESNDPGIPTLIPDSTTTSPLPQCAQWADLQDNKISKEEAVGRKDIKCIAVNTAIGPISTEPQAFVRSIFSLVLGIAGGIALILIILSGYRMMASQGNPESLTNARQQLVSAIVGLLFIIFSFVILQVIGVDILKIPGFDK